MTDPNPDLDPDEVEQANVAAAAIAGFTLAQFSFGELIKSGVLAKGDAEHLLRQAIETHETAGPGNRGAAELLAVVLQSLSAIQPPIRQQVGLISESMSNRLNDDQSAIIIIMQAGESIAPYDNPYRRWRACEPRPQSRRVRRLQAISGRKTHQRGP
jgi:hypothetical protein